MPRSGPFTAGKGTRYPLCSRLGGPQGTSRRVRKISPPPGVDPRTVQPVGCRYSDCTVRPKSNYIYVCLCMYVFIKWAMCLKASKLARIEGMWYWSNTFIILKIRGQRLQGDSASCLFSGKTMSKWEGCNGSVINVSRVMISVMGREFTCQHFRIE